MPGIFATAVNCMDGRVQHSVNQWARERFGAEYIDTVTEAGPVASLAGRADSPGSGADIDEVFESIRRRVAVSVEAHGSKSIVVAAHEGCAGNPVDDETQKSQCRASATALATAFPNCEVIPVWVLLNGQIELLS
ncbi:MAG: hypothetical protein HOM34_00535 [Planctomycetes bacterium]|nr:hypothetical protein [Planctomycetota bacterium]MBT4027918.1 hypothetical protein [Planctomycetota bacterium]MBT5119191.1 hypothetical protein [Planctomycetota bacterium]MBT7012688.1 hypothetical protein [Planctomycetota bacterium]